MMDQIKEIEKFISDHVNSAHSKGVVLGMSGGKDSLICAKLCSNALGKDKVVGMIMPNGEMKDINIAIESCKLLGIRYYNLNINDLYNIYLQLIKPVLKDQSVDISSVTTINLPPRLRTICLYALAGSLNYLVVNTSKFETSTVDNIIEYVDFAQGSKKFTGVISNTHFGDETTKEDVINGYDKLKIACEKINLPICAIGIDEKLKTDFDAKYDGVEIWVYKRMMPKAFW